MLNKTFELWMANDIEKEINDFCYLTGEPYENVCMFYFEAFSTKKGKKQGWYTGWPPIKVRVNVTIEKI